MKQKPANRIVSFLLALLLLLGAWPVYALPAAAAAGDVPIDAEHFPDGNFRDCVRQFDTDGDGVLSPAEINEVTELWCESTGISSLKGISYFTALKKLFCGGNQLTALDVSGNPKLSELYCEINQLTALDVSGNPELYDLCCGGNQLTALDVSGNPELKYLSCHRNQLTALDVSGNPELKFLLCSENQLTALDISGNPKLCYLYCGANQLTALDVSGNPELEILSCGGNQLTALDVSGNPELKFLLCSENQLTALDVSGNPKLKYLSCYGNQLTALDVSRNAALSSLSCGWNQLTALDVSGNPELEALYCYNNQLTALDVSNNAALEYLSCENNQIEVLDISNNPMLEDALIHGERVSSIREYCCYTSADYEHEISFDKTTTVLLSDGSTFRDSPFADVDPGSYYYQPVLWAIENGITKGTDANHFSPDADCTREQIVTFLWAAAGKLEPESTENPFTDVSNTAWYLKPVLWAKEEKITSGVGGGKFGVGQSCTREQVVTFLWAAAGKPEPESAENAFADVPDSAWYRNAVLWAVENGITKGVGGGKFGVGQSCTRAQIVTFLYKYCSKQN